MEKSNKRGKIPQSDWPQIMARYEAGETLASIAKTYDCSPPAISYIVSRSRARHSNGDAAPTVTEPQLIKTHPHAPAEVPVEMTPPAAPPAQNDTTTATAASLFVQDGPPPRADHGFAGHSGNGNGAGFAGRDNGTDSGFPGLPPAATRPAAIGPVQPTSARPPEQQRTLHLGFGNGGANHSNGSAAATPPPAQGNSDGMMVSEQAQHARPSNPSPPMPEHGGGEHHQPRPTAPPLRPFDQPRYSYGQPDHHHRPGNGGAANKDVPGSYIDQELRARVDGDIAAFLSAFDAALAQDTQDSRSALREATDRLLRAGARTRIELERLEARVPLPPRDSATRAEQAWRPR